MKTKLIYQHNAITEARYAMSALEKNILYLLMAQIRDENQPGKIFHISYQTLEKYTGRKIDQKSFKQTANLLVKKVISLKLGKQDFVDMTIFASAKYAQGQGTVDIELSKDVWNLFFDLKKHFTAYELSAVLSMKSKYAKRLYEMLSQYKDTNKMYITISEFKERFCIADKYSAFGSLKKYVLEVARKEIEARTTLQFTYNAKKTGKKYTHLTFFINQKGIQDQQADTSQHSSKAKKMELLCTKFALSAWQAQRILKTVPDKALHQELYGINLALVNGKIKNIGGYTAKRFDQKYRLGLFKD